MESGLAQQREHDEARKEKDNDDDDDDDVSTSGGGGWRLSLEDKAVAAFAAGMQSDLVDAVASGALALSLAEVGFVCDVGLAVDGKKRKKKDSPGKGSIGSLAVNGDGDGSGFGSVANFTVHAILVPLDVGLSVEFKRCQTLLATGGLGDLDEACRKEGMGVLIGVLLVTLFYFYCCLRILAYCRCARVDAGGGPAVTALPASFDDSWKGGLSDDDGLGSEYGETFERRGRLNDECNRRCNGTNAVETADGSDDGEDDDMGAGSDDAYV